MRRDDFKVSDLGPPNIDNPIGEQKDGRGKFSQFIDDDDRILFDVRYRPDLTDPPLVLERAGPREKIFFTPGRARAGILTCGGLCPGLNDVIRSLTRCLWYRYGVERITGIQFGYRGLLPEYGLPTIDLNPDKVDDIHRIGGSVLGASRGGGERTRDIVDEIERLNLNIVCIIGGDGSQKGALCISQEIMRRGTKIAVVGIPKTIDNDLSYIEKTFGFETAVNEASKVVYASHAEAHSAFNGIGLVKLMGRESGFIAAHTALASNDANFVLIPEIPFDLEGPDGLFIHLRRRLERRQHAVIIVAEGAGQRFLTPTGKEDASGNTRLADIGIFLRDQIIMHFRKENFPINLKYIDPSYLLRGAVAVPGDSLYCSRLAHNAVHAAMAGKTQVLISLLNGHFVHIPMAAGVSQQNTVEPQGALWRDVLEATLQPRCMLNS